ncbi:MAG: ABC transporter ATP-binding protein [Flavobacteriales bacterium]|nr:ABC transporter ATP-binding protein [Flavobacteriales bacterium]
MRELSYLNKYLVKYKGRLLLGTLFIIVSNIFKVLMPEILKNATNSIKYVLDNIEQHTSEDIASIAISLGLLFMLYALLNGIFLFLTRQTIIIMSRLIEYDLKNEIYDKYQQLSMSFYKRNNTGDLMNRISEDVSKVRMYLGQAIMYTINVAVLIVMVISFMIKISPLLTLYVLIPLPIMSILVYKVSYRINKKSEITQVQQSKLSTFVQETFSGIRVLKAYNRESFFKNEFDQESENYKTASLNLAKTNAFFIPVIVSLIGLSTVIIVYFGGLKSINNELSIGEILQFIFYINMLTWPIASIGWVTSLIQRAAASQKRVNEFLQENPEITDGKNSVKFKNGKIVFNNVSFAYSNTNKEVLKNISFEIEKGKTLAITGKTGSGKSTLANLICRLFDANTGEVSINGMNVKQIQKKSLRTNIGYVPQEVFLFSDTIASNIAFGNKSGKSNNKEVQDAAKQAAVHDNIVQFKNGFDTVIGERGITLSGGQKQRISIARAIINNPEILIFDDCLSAVDTKTEEAILSNLKGLMNKKTSIIISHRISSIKNADYIIVLDKGLISEKGTHSELINNKGYYSTTFEKQLLEEKMN